MKAVRILIIVGLFIFVASIIIISIPISRKLTIKNSKKYLGETIVKMGKTWYEEVYYTSVVETHGIENGIKKHEYQGINISLDTLRIGVKDNEKLFKEFKNPITKDPCNPYETKITIYPEEPYDINSYRIEYTLSCGFEE